MRTLTLLIPGLFGPPKGLSEDTVPELPALEVLLAKAKRQRIAPAGFCARLCGLFGYDKNPDQDLPIGAITRLVDDDEKHEGIWMRADPVHLSAGRDAVMLMESSVFSLSQHDAIVLAASLQPLFEEQGWQLEIPLPSRWYLKLSERPSIVTTEINEVLGRNIHRFMGAGEGRQQWIQLMNDVQMLLHDCDVNRERENRGELIINSLWFWGAGQLPEIIQRKWSSLFSDEPVAKGLAMLSGTPLEHLPGNANEILNSTKLDQDVLVVISELLPHCRYWDITAWQDAVNGIEQKWFAPLYKALKQGSLQRFVILSEECQFTVSRPSLAKFWCRQQSLLTHAENFIV